MFAWDMQRILVILADMQCQSDIPDVLQEVDPGQCAGWMQWTKAAENVSINDKAVSSGFLIYELPTVLLVAWYPLHLLSRT